ncbi:MAG TPA: hypothetical protein VGF73_05985 [Chthoniobacterales bacterium]|jgi:hypothetical protein
MKTFFVLVLSVTALFVWQRKAEEAGNATPRPAVNADITTAAQPSVSEHNWAKNSLDRAHEVMDQVRETREQNDQR